MRRERTPPGGNSNNAAAAAAVDPYSMALVPVSSNPFASALVAPTLEQKVQRFAEKSRDSRRINVGGLPFNIEADEVKRVFLAKVTNLRKEMIDSDMARYKNENNNNNNNGASSFLNNSNNDENNTNNNKGKIFQHLPPNAVVDIDMITDISINPPTKPGAGSFGYVEFLLDDVVNKIVTENIPIEFVQPETKYAPAQIISCRCKRPFNYVPMNATDDTRIYIAGVPNAVDIKEQFEKVLSDFGDINRLSAIANLGFYVEYHDALAAEKAVKGLTGYVFGERALYANYASEAFKIWLMTRGIEVTGLFEDEDLYEAANAGRFNLDYRYSNSVFAPDPLRDYYDDVYNRRISLTQCLVNFVHTQKHLRKSWPVVTPTRILVLMNLFDPELEFPLHGNTEETRKKQIDELRSEIEDEVEKYGRVRHLFLITDPPQPPQVNMGNEFDEEEEVVSQQQHEQRNQQQQQQAPGEELDAAEALLQQIDGIGAPSKNNNNNSISKQQESISTTTKPQLTAEERRQKEIEQQQKNEQAMFEWHKQRLHPIFGENAVGKVFVEYETVEEAEKAQRAIAGRLFNGRTIITSYLFEDVLYPPANEDEEDEEEDEDEKKQKEQQQEQQNLQQDAAAAAVVTSEQQQTTTTRTEGGGDVTITTSLDDELD